MGQGTNLEGSLRRGVSSTICSFLSISGRYSGDTEVVAAIYPSDTEALVVHNGQGDDVVNLCNLGFFCAAPLHYQKALSSSS
jgi:hypothetical protein